MAYCENSIPLGQCLLTWRIWPKCCTSTFYTGADSKSCSLSKYVPPGGVWCAICFSSSWHGCSIPSSMIRGFLRLSSKGHRGCFI